MRFRYVYKLQETKFSIATHKSRELGPQTPIRDPPSGEVSVHDPDLAPLLTSSIGKRKACSAWEKRTHSALGMVTFQEMTFCADAHMFEGTYCASLNTYLIRLM